MLLYVADFPTIYFNQIYTGIIFFQHSYVKRFFYNAAVSVVKLFCEKTINTRCSLHLHRHFPFFFQYYPHTKSLPLKLPKFLNILRFSINKSGWVNHCRENKYKDNIQHKYEKINIIQEDELSIVISGRSEEKFWLLKIYLREKLSRHVTWGCQE